VNLLAFIARVPFDLRSSDLPGPLAQGGRAFRCCQGNHPSCDSGQYDR